MPLPSGIDSPAAPPVGTLEAWAARTREMLLLLDRAGDGFRHRQLLRPTFVRPESLGNPSRGTQDIGGSERQTPIPFDLS